MVGSIALLLLAACTTGTELPPAPPPPTGEVSVTLLPTPPSADSDRIRRYFAGVERNLSSQGLLRTDPGTSDAPFTAADLAQNFTRIALYDEYVAEDGVLVARATPSTLRRWQGPVRIGVEFGPSVPVEQRAKDLADISAVVARLARATGHPIRVDNRQPNFTVLIVNEDERRAIGPRLTRIVPRIGKADVAATVGMTEQDYCLVIAFSPGSRQVYTQAVAVIRAEHPGLLRQLCIHEELAQGLGLVNDFPAARPSIFNDDEEFALLTPHDELLLRMLYDPRLRPGMSETEARPVVREIAEELVPGSG